MTKRKKERRAKKKAEKKRIKKDKQLYTQRREPSKRQNIYSCLDPENPANISWRELTKDFPHDKDGNPITPFGVIDLRPIVVKRDMRPESMM